MSTQDEAAQEQEELDWGAVRKEEHDVLRQWVTEPGGDGKFDAKQLFGLALSGGGIRSATFNLGVIQALASMRLLRRIDYLSTVSGGGYIGSWLSSWIRRECKPQRDDAGVPTAQPKAIEVVEEHLAPNTMPPTLASRYIKSAPISMGEVATGDAEPIPVRWLRANSNYITPQVGLLSIDTLTAVATYSRNLILNFAILISGILAALALARIIAMPWANAQAVACVLFGQDCAASRETLNCWLLLVSLAAIITATWSMTQQRAAFRSALFLLLAAYGLSVHVGLDVSFLPTSATNSESVVSLVSGLSPMGRLLGVAALGSFLPVLISFAAIKTTSPLSRVGRLLAYMGGLVILLVGLFLVQHLLKKFAPTLETALNDPTKVVAAYRTHVAVWGVPGMLIAFSLAGITYLGLAGRSLDEGQREWWGKLGAYLIMLMISWLFLVGIAAYGPFLMLRINRWFPEISLAWIVSTIGGVLLARSPSTGDANSNRWIELLTKVLPYVFVIGLVIAASWLVMWWQHNLQLVNAVPFIRWIDHPLAMRDVVDIRCLCFRESQDITCAFSEYAKLLSDESTNLWILLAITIPFAALLTWRVDINLFSFHMFYRNRLVRCYLRASNIKLQSDEAKNTGKNGGQDSSKDSSTDQSETGLDPTDSLELKHIAQRPYHILGTALNLTRTGAYSGWQQRKAMPFFFSPKFCGYSAALSSGVVHGTEKNSEYFCRTEEFAKLDMRERDDAQKKYKTHPPAPATRLSLGRALAISGAAASPNMGFHSSPAVAFLLTVFNVRLGWWMQNTAKPQKWKTLGPKFSWRYLMQELFGRAGDQTDYVYLSDGGHFENLGLYELVRRRCRYIVCVDVSGDPRFAFEDLANAIRKCQIDLGAEIQIDTRAIRPNADTGLSRYHCVVGTIRYSKLDTRDGAEQQEAGADQQTDTDGAKHKEPEEIEEGYLLYVKPSLTGNEPADIANYRTTNPQFPHQSTADQWFDESQFESYRKLGQHIMTEILRGADVKPDLDVETMFVRLKDRWYPPSSAVTSSFSKHGDQFKALMDDIRSNPDLRFLDAQIYPEWRQLEEGRSGRARIELWLPRKAAELRAGFYLCNQVIQMMENVYHDLNLEEDEEWNHPDNRGWRNLFKHWSWSGMFRVAYAVSGPTYGKRFTEFCRRRLELEFGDIEIARHEINASESNASEINAPKVKTPEIKVESPESLENLLRTLEVENRLNFYEAGLLREARYVALDSGNYDELIFMSLYVKNPSFIRPNPDRTHDDKDHPRKLDETVAPGRKSHAASEPPERTLNDGLSLSVGFALAKADDEGKAKEVVFLRIQDHLRHLGLSRMAVRRMKIAGYSIADEQSIRNMMESLGQNDGAAVTRFRQFWETVPEIREKKESGQRKDDASNGASQTGVSDSQDGAASPTRPR